MENVDLSIVIGGPQGGGIDTASNMISKAFAYSGYQVISVREFHSNIKGRHSYVHLRVKNSQVRSLKYPVDILVALDPDTIFEHHEDISKGTRVLYDADFETSELSQARMIMRDTSRRIKEMLESAGHTLNVRGVLDYMKSKGAVPIPISFGNVVSEAVSDGTPTRYFNTFGAAATLAVLGIDKNYVEKVIKSVFGNKEKVIGPNIKVVDAAYDYCANHKLRIKNLPDLEMGKKMLLTGNDGSAIGKVLGGLRFQTYYPITPASDESTILEEHEELKWMDGENTNLITGGVTVVQAEDEISAINMASGAAMTGTRSATATSGPGFSLMAEAISFAGMDEIPLVVTLYQRGGPSTGLPTRNGQSDLLFALHTGHGEFPRMVISSGDVKECIEDSARALNYAQRYQLPVIHLIDKNLANTTELVDIPDGSSIKIQQPDRSDGKDAFSRFTLDTNNGISPIGYFGKDIFWLTGDEHDEKGHVTEDTWMRDRQMEKRFLKLQTAEEEIPISERAVVLGPAKADVTFITWGSQKGLVLDVIDALGNKGIKANLLYLKMFEPFPSKFVSEVLKKAKTVIGVESNMTAQACKVIKMNTGIDVENLILKYNGRHVTEDEVIEASLKIIEKKEKVVVLENGA
jgi:2-oxoglutarate ferredoxin oxidoreductase subunit alpha